MKIRNGVGNNTIFVYYILFMFVTLNDIKAR